MILGRGGFGWRRIMVALALLGTGGLAALVLAPVVIVRFGPLSPPALDGDPYLAVMNPLRVRAPERAAAAVLDHLPFETNQGQLTLPDYLGRQATINGKRPLYFFTHDADANQFYTLCQARGLLAINAGRPFDETLLRRHASQQPDTVELKPLDRLDDPTWYERLDATEQAKYARLERAMDRALAEMETRVKTQVRRFRPDDLSAVLLAGQRVAASDAMEQALEKPFLLDGLAELAGEVRDRLRRQPLTLLLNAAHPLVRRLGEVANPAEARYRPLLTGLYHAALLNAQHRLTPAAARRFHADLQALLLEHLELQVRDSSSSTRN